MIKNVIYALFSYINYTKFILKKENILKKAIHPNIYECIAFFYVNGGKTLYLISLSLKSLSFLNFSIISLTTSLV